MGRFRVLAWWLAFQVARGALWLLVQLLLWPMRLLELLVDARDEAEVSWLLACTGRRVGDRKRLRLADQVQPFPGSET